MSSWTITSGSAAPTAAATASASSASAIAASAPSASISPRFAGERLIPVTSCPAASSIGKSCLPRAPVAPATKTFIVASFVAFTPETREGVGL